MKTRNMCKENISAATRQNLNKMACAPNEDSDQPGYLHGAHSEDYDQTRLI